MELDELPPENPTTAIIGEMVPCGLLISYGQDYFRKAVATVDRLLRALT
jgi:hypothetical protein